MKNFHPKLSLYGLYLSIGLSLGGCLFQEDTFIPLNADFGFARFFVRTGDSIIFNNASQLAFSHKWDFGDGNTSDLSEPTHVYKDTGRYKVVLVTAKKDGITTDTASAEIVVLPPLIETNSLVPVPTGSDEAVGYNITQLQDGNLLLVGRQNLRTLQVIKTSTAGDDVWQSNFDNLSGGQLIVNATKELSDNSIVIVGYYFDAQGANDAFIIKLDADGREVWRNRLATVDNEIYKDVVEDPNGNLVVLGSINASNIQLDRYSAAGVLNQSTSFGETHVPESMLLSSTNKIVVSGTNNKVNPFILQTDLDFTQEKFQNLQLTGEVFKIIQLDDGAFAVAGTTPDDSSARALVAKVDANGLGTVWQTSPLAFSKSASQEAFTDIVQTGQSLIVSGSHQSVLNNDDVFLCKYGIAGTDPVLEGIKVYGGDGNDIARQMLFDNTNLYFFGETNSFNEGRRVMYLVRLDLNLN